MYLGNWINKLKGSSDNSSLWRIPVYKYRRNEENRVSPLEYHNNCHRQNSFRMLRLVGKLKQK